MDLSVHTVTWRIYNGLLLGSGRGAVGKQCLLAVGYVWALPEPRTERPRRSEKHSFQGTHGQCGSCIPSSRLENLVGSISNMSVYIFFLSQQNMARKKHHMSELDVN